VSYLEKQTYQYI